MTKGSRQAVQRLISVALLLMSTPSFAHVNAKRISKTLTLAEEQLIIQQNLKVKREQILQLSRQHAGQRDLLSPVAMPTVARPFSDHERVSYVFFSAENYYDSAHVKKTILQNLPADVVAVVFADSANVSVIESYRQEYSQYVQNPDQLVVIASPNLLMNGSNLWARDNVPIPVYSQDAHVLSIDAQYYRFYEADQSIANFLGTQLLSHGYYYEGGNFQADDDGTCLMVNNSRHQVIPESLFIETYGCKRLKRLEHLSGIGHVDERLKIMKNKRILTDTVEYRVELEEMGYQVVMLPRPQRAFETYANALVVNDTVFLPVFHELHDAEAIQIYEQQGLKVVPVYVNDLPNQGRGSIHCITMTYPSIQ